VNLDPLLMYRGRVMEEPRTTPILPRKLFSIVRKTKKPSLLRQSLSCHITASVLFPAFQIVLTSAGVQNRGEDESLSIANVPAPVEGRASDSLNLAQEAVQRRPEDETGSFTETERLLLDDGEYSVFIICG
jgi:hypothetical protein